MINIQPNQLARFIKVQDNAAGYLSRSHAWLFREFDIEGIRFGIVVKFHDLIGLRHKAFIHESVMCCLAIF